MTDARREILDWAEQGALDPAALLPALRTGGVLPDAAQWRQFLDRLLLWMGVVMLCASVIFFLAYNWAALGRYAKFALVEVPLIAVLGLVWRLGFDRVSGKAALTAAALLTGALLALIGQTYQTGADTFELFAAWAVATLPWVLIGRFAPLWVLWLAIVNCAASFYYQAFHGLFGILFGPESMLWVLFALNTAALVAWEFLARAGVTWLHERWAPRLLATASGGLITVLALYALLDWGDASGWALPVWLAWLGAAYAIYRRQVKDVYVLAGGCLSLIIVTATFLGEHLLRGGDSPGAFLFIGLVVIGLSALAGMWLRGVAAESTP